MHKNKIELCANQMSRNVQYGYNFCWIRATRGKRNKSSNPRKGNLSGSSGQATDAAYCQLYKDNTPWTDSSRSKMMPNSSDKLYKERDGSNDATFGTVTAVLAAEYSKFELDTWFKGRGIIRTQSTIDIVGDTRYRTPRTKGQLRVQIERSIRYRKSNGSDAAILGTATLFLLWMKNLSFENQYTGGVASCVTYRYLQTHLQVNASRGIVVHHHIGGYPPHFRPEERGVALVAPQLQLQPLQVQGCAERSAFVGSSSARH